MNLNAWQERLSTQFAQLRDERAGRGAHSAVYAIEHGLGEQEIADLTREIDSFLVNSSPARRHYLAWVVYSAEIGYHYSGEEYWDTFSARTPHWNNSYRDYIRDSYYEFHRNFKAARPRGRWADHFKIICWPITHAILPQDLQRELAQVLYQLRGSFNSQLLHDPEALGKRIRDAAWNSGARFRKFVEDHLLVGQISTALLLSDEEKHNALVLPKTLERITRDLNRVQKSREWLSYARQRALQVNIHGLGSGDAREAENAMDATSRLNSRQREVLELGIEPDLYVVNTGPNVWIVRLRLPSFSGLIRRFESLRDAVANQYCTIAGTEPRTFPKGYLLFGEQEVTLKRWPASDELLIKFAQPHEELDYLLTTECLLRPGPLWLFKISGDGTARHVKTGVVKPGSSYLLVTRNDTTRPDPSSLNSAKVTLNCEGVSAVRLDIPDSVSKLYSEGLDALELHLAGGLEVGPVGVPPAKWDEGGVAEWISTDQPLIEVAADFDVDGILLNLVGPEAERLELQKPNWPLFVDLGKRVPGVYELHVVVSRAESESLVRGVLQFTIREPKVWSHDKSSATPFAARVSPASPTLDELWEGDVTIELLGPNNHKAECELRFFTSGSEKPILERKFGPIGLPAGDANWSEVWQKVTADKDNQNAFDASAECELLIRCDFGRYVLRAVRESKPLRWIVKQENSGYFLRFEQLDDHASIAFSRYLFRTPTEFGAVSADPFSGFRVSEEGGLFVASAQDSIASVVIPPVIHSLRWLSPEAPVLHCSRSESSVSQLLRAIEVWSGARAVGNLFALQRKMTVVDALQQELIRIFCGDEWLDAERKREQNLLRVEDLRNFVSPAVRYGPLGNNLIAKRELFQTQTMVGKIELLHRLSSKHLDFSMFSTAQDRGVSRQQWATEFAYRAVTQPQTLREWARDGYFAGLAYLLKLPILCRLCRFAFLLSDIPGTIKPHAQAATI